MTYEQIWTYKGRKCRIAFLADKIQGHWVGYCKTTTELDARALNSTIQVHGGITWGPDDDNWVGFDCIHAGDTNIGPNGEAGASALGITRETWTEARVMQETEKLADQLMKVESGETEVEP